MQLMDVVIAYLHVSLDLEIHTTSDIEEAMGCLKMEFEMKDLGKTKFCLGLQLEHLHAALLIQRGYLKSSI
jgi:hypothetical protein